MANFTATNHKSVYPAIDSSLPELSQTGRTVLITGASYGIGYAAMDAFARASAARIILLGRQEKNLSSAIQRLRAERPSFLGQLIPYVCDISDESVVDHVWKDLNQKDIAIDTIVLNAAEMGSEGHIESNPLPRIWKTFEVNVRGNLDMVQRFVKQGKSMDFQGRKRSLVNISSCVIHDPELAEGYGSYAVSKIAFTSFVQFLATEVPVEEIQIVSIHPGGIYTEGLQDMCAKGSWSWDDVSLPGNFIVWASSPGAAFLHGRFVWASWDITELQKLFSSHRDPEELKHLLKIHVNGLE